MNKVILMGRLTRDPEIRYSSGENQTAIARYTLAVDRRQQRSDEQTADFINCVVFGKGADFAENYLRQGTKIVVSGRIQTGSYTNRDGQRVYTTDVVVEEQEFAESKNSSSGGSSSVNNQQRGDAERSAASGKGKSSSSRGKKPDGFMDASGYEDDLPFN